MEVVIDFFGDAAKIVFASAVVGFFIPGFSKEVAGTTLLGGLRRRLFSWF